MNEEKSLREEGIRKIGEYMDELLEEEKLTGLKEVLRIRGAWEELAGRKIAEKTRPIKLEGKVLYVGAESHAWAQEFAYGTEKIKSKLAGILGLKVDSIIVKQINLK